MLFESKQHLLTYANVFVRTAVLLVLDKFVVKPNFTACFISFTLIIGGVLLDYMLSENAKFYYPSFMQILAIPTFFLIFYFYHKKKKIEFNLSLFLLCCILGINFFCRAKIVEYYRYGTESALLEKEIPIYKLELLDKKGRDTIFSFDDKVYMIGIWGLYCPLCYYDMLFIDSIKKVDSTLQLVSLLKYRKQDSVKCIKKINELSNSYHSYLLKDSSLLKHLDITKVPNYLILNKNKIVFRNSKDKVLKKYYELKNN